MKMAFNNRKFQKLMEEEQKNNASFVDEFEDDFADDFDETPVEEAQPETAGFAPEAMEVTEIEPATEEAPVEIEPVEEPVEETVEEAPEIIEEPAVEEPEEEAHEEETVPQCEEEPVIVAAPVTEPVVEVAYDPHKMWQDMAALAVKAKACITAGAFFRANDIVSAMRSMLVEMMCRNNGITENFNENADNLNDECKQDIYTSYASTLNAQELSGAVTHIMAVTYKYI